MIKRSLLIAALAISVIVLFAWEAQTTPQTLNATEQYYRTFENENGFCIKDRILYAYLGNETEITIPEGVTEIYESALSWDFDHGVNLKKVIVPGTVEKIDQGAFAFTVADTIIIKEGVKEIGEWAFGDSYIDEIWFPNSLEIIGGRIMETEEGLWDTKIHVFKDSKIALYFEQSMPYGSAELIYNQ